MDWFRSHHGAPSDPKWQLIARKANVPTCAVVSLFWMLLDHASQHSDRGCIDGFDTEVAAMYLGLDDDQVEAIMQALQSKEIIVQGRLANWEKRQPKREREDDCSTERVQKHRAQKREAASINETPTLTADTIVTPDTTNVTPCNAMKRTGTPREDKIREDLLPPTPFKGKTPKETTKKPFAFDDPLPVNAEGLLSGLPPWFEGHLRNALAGRSPDSLASYASQIVRDWRAGRNTPQAPLPDVPIHAAPPDTPLPPGARILSLAEVRAKRIAQEATHTVPGGSHATQ
jgi:hypothetical protein